MSGMSTSAIAESITSPVIHNNMSVDNINHPAHYKNHPSGRECIEIAGQMSFTLGNAFKYAYRCTEKGNPLDDLKKCRWYLEYEMSRRAKRRFRWMAESHEDYNAEIDGCDAISDVLGYEHRYCGHLSRVLERIYTAHKHPRGLDAIKEALDALSLVIKLYLLRNENL